MSVENIYDIAIIGLGPSGATLARLLDKRFKVIAIDKKDHLKSFEKPCGGLLATDAQKYLSKFNMTLPLNVLVNPQIFTVKTIDTQKKLIRHYQRFYMNLNRHKFDLWLKSLIPQHVEVIDGSICKKIQQTEFGYMVDYIIDNKQYTISARNLVGADGANSFIRRSLLPGKKIRKYMAIQEWYKDEHKNPFYSCIFDKEITDCYGWSVSKEGMIIVGGAFPMRNPRESFLLMKKKLSEYGFIFGDVVKKEACLVLRPNGLFDICTGNHNFYLIGEAAGFISPSSLEGISYAFESAYILSCVLNSGKSHRIYFFKTLKIRLRLFFKNLKNPFMYFPPLRFLIMKSNIKSISILDEE